MMCHPLISVVVTTLLFSASGAHGVLMQNQSSTLDQPPTTTDQETLIVDAVLQQLILDQITSGELPEKQTSSDEDPPECDVCRAECEEEDLIRVCDCNHCECFTCLRRYYKDLYPNWSLCPLNVPQHSLPLDVLDKIRQGFDEFRPLLWPGIEDVKDIPVSQQAAEERGLISLKAFLLGNVEDWATEKLKQFSMRVGEFQTEAMRDGILLYMVGRCILPDRGHSCSEEERL